MITTISATKPLHRKLLFSAITILLISISMLFAYQFVYLWSAKATVDIVMFNDAELELTAFEIIEQNCKGSINQEFPDDFYKKKLKEIKELAQGKGDLARKAKKAWKLLTDNRFRK